MFGHMLVIAYIELPTALAYETFSINSYSSLSLGHIFLLNIVHLLTGIPKALDSAVFNLLSTSPNSSLNRDTIILHFKTFWF